MGAGRLAVYTVVRSHDSLDIRFFNEGLKGREVGLEKILFRNLGVEGMTYFFGSAVGGKVLCTGGGL